MVESIAKFFDEIDVIGALDYCPTPQHVLIARVRTSGIVTESYVIDGNTFEMYVRPPPWKPPWTRTPLHQPRQHTLVATIP